MLRLVSGEDDEADEADGHAEPGENSEADEAGGVMRQ